MKYVTLDPNVRIQRDKVRTALSRIDRVVSGHITTSTALAGIDSAVADLLRAASGLADAIDQQNRSQLTEAA